MRFKKLLAAALAVTVLAATTPPALRADDESDARRYAKREAATPELADFTGGCPGPDGGLLVVIILTLPITLPLFGVYLLGKSIGDGIKSLCGSEDEPPPTKREPAPAGNEQEKKCSPDHEGITRALPPGLAAA